jgi:hypothetical protein
MRTPDISQTKRAVDKSCLLNRKSALILSALAPLVIAVLAFTKPVQAQPAENPIKVSGEEFNFGYIPFGKIVKHTLYIVNDADTSLRITKVNPGCGCTSIPLTKRTANPGDTLTVNILLDTGKFELGKFQKAPRIFTDSRKRPVITCKLTGINYDTDGQKLLDISPTSIELPRNRNSDTTSITLFNLSKLTLIPRLIEAPPPGLIDVSLPGQALVPGREMAVSLKINDLSSVKEDALIASFTLAFDDPNRTRLTIPIKVLK